ncbi:MAG: glutathione S-transferase family protein [Candidatus Binatia bacterium]
MERVILHQYATSPFSEKIRRILAFKKISWSGVEQPIIAPKPNLTPLTGGYRKIPVMQIGADVWCDTAVIARLLERLRPTPSIFPGGGTGAQEALAHWADHWLFMATVPPVIAKVLPLLPPGFVEDRQKMSPAFTARNLEDAVPHSRSTLLAALDWLDTQLRGRSFLLGDAFGLADAACFHVLWFLRNDPESFALVERRSALKEWFDRVEAFGPGDFAQIDPDEALAIAKKSEPSTTEEDDGSDPNGLRPGARVSVVPDDYGTEVVTGTAVVVTSQSIALRRRDGEVGEVVVHFPRAGFRVTRC